MSDNPNNGMPVAESSEEAGDKADEIAIEVETDAGAADAQQAGQHQQTGSEAGTGAIPAQGEGPAEDASAQAASQVIELQGEVARLQAEVSRLDKEKNDNWDRFLRATADLDNARKRARRDVDEAGLEATSKILKEMLPIIDNLERAVEHAESSAAPGETRSGVLEGVRLVLRQFAHALERFNVKAVDAVGHPFDPNLHEAISQIETDEQLPGSVVQALQKGYKIGERLLRPSLVVVAKAPPPAADQAEQVGQSEVPVAEPGSQHEA
jgi:molecular chaperone GrpE